MMINRNTVRKVQDEPVFRLLAGHRFSGST
eukprot:SAG31_NODE_40364_length_281_cov_0.846154_1_plen_29_part_10